MTTHPIDTEALRRLADAATPGPWDYPGELLGSPCTTVFAGDPKRTHAVYLAAAMPENGAFIAAARTAVPALLDLLAAAEHRATRAEAQAAIRGRAVVMYRDRAREAEAERDEWRQTALGERAAALDALDQIKARDARAAHIWDEGWSQGMAYVTGMERGTDDDHAITNPYRASETA